MAYRGTMSFGYGLTPWVKRLLIANVAIFVLTSMVAGLTMMFAFVPAWILVRPWTVITYMFLHGNFWHLFFNMIGLFFFGPPLEERWGSSRFLKFYFISGLGGAAFSFLFAFQYPVIGASAAVYGILLAFALNWPNMPIYIWGILPIPAKYLVGILGVMSLYSAVASAGGGVAASSNVAHFAHLGGFVFGYIYMRMMGSSGAGSGAGPISGLRRYMARRRLRVVDDEAGAAPGRPGGQAGPATRSPDKTRPDPQLLDELDRVLDKISNEGMSSLTPHERKLLDDVSKKFRQN